MLFLDDFLEMLDELPMELRERCTEMKHLDLQVETGLERNRKAIIEFFEGGSDLTEEQKMTRYQQLQQEYRRLRQLGEEKVSIAERMQELIEKYVQHLEKEKTHFKYELEADNPGVTETIEKRFADYVESVIAMRKELKRKHHNGNGSIETVEPPPKIIKLVNDNFSMSTTIRAELSLGDDDFKLISPMLSGAGPLRSRKNTLDEFSQTAKRRSNTSSAKGSLAVPSVLSANVVSPAVSEKSWTPASSIAVEEYSPTAAHTSSVSFVAGQMPPTTMPTFVGPESRHGRPRKLTSRVQEMFKEAVQRQRHHHTTIHLAETTTEDDDGGSEDDEEDSDDARRTWCFCNEKSYGDMVACDNKACPYQWFHYPCVSITATPKGRWYCPHCVSERNRRSNSAEGLSNSGALI